jgi:predicted ATPase
MRFHHQLRSDDEAPARQPGLSTRSLAVSDDGSDLAAALMTIKREGDAETLRRCVADAFDGAELKIREDETGRLDFATSNARCDAPTVREGALRRPAPLPIPRGRLVLAATARDGGPQRA